MWIQVCYSQLKIPFEVKFRTERVGLIKQFKLADYD